MRSTRKKTFGEQLEELSCLIERNDEGVGIIAVGMTNLEFMKAFSDGGKRDKAEKRITIRRETDFLTSVGATWTASLTRKEAVRLIRGYLGNRG